MPGRDGFWLLERVPRRDPRHRGGHADRLRRHRGGGGVPAERRRRLPAQAAEGHRPHPRHRARARAAPAGARPQRVPPLPRDAVREKTAELLPRPARVRGDLLQTLCSLCRRARRPRARDERPLPARGPLLPRDRAAPRPPGARPPRPRPRRAPPRHREDRGARRDPAQAREALRRGVGRDEAAPADRLRHPPLDPLPRHLGGDGPRAPGAASTAAGTRAASPARRSRSRRGSSPSPTPTTR